VSAIAIGTAGGRPQGPPLARSGSALPAPIEDPLLLVGYEHSLDSSTLDALDRVQRAFPPDRLDELFGRGDGTEEATMLRTCHRLEVLLVVRSREEADRWREELPGDPGAWRAREGAEVVRHVFSVAAGRESLAFGEREIRDQVRRARGATRSRHPRPILRSLLESAVRAAEAAAPVVPPERSVAGLAVARLLSLLDRPSPKVLVVGSGAVGRRVAILLAPHAAVTLVYRTAAPEAAFLQETGCRAIPLEGLREALLRCDAVVTAAKSGDGFLGPAALPEGKPLVLVDLGVPRNIDPAVRDRPGVALVDLGDLRAAVARPRLSIEEETRSTSAADACFAELRVRLGEPSIAAVRRAAEEIRALELARARPFLGSLGAEQEVAVDRLTRHLVARLLQPATDLLRTLPPGPEGDRLRRLALELLRPADPRP
jgi:glutamyl-tRNA reductase